MKISKSLLGFMLCAFAFIYSEEARANACLVASETGSSENCDNGSAQVGLPQHDLTTTSKKGTTGLCNNVNVFADKEQAEEYAKTHEYDDTYLENGCHKPKCTYESDCSNATRTCCKSLINDKCWHECDICRFNKIGSNYYPYADKTMEDCELVGKGMMNSTNALYTDTHTQRNYQINRIINVEPADSWNTDIWKCSYSNVTSILSECKTKAAASKYIQGFMQQWAPGSKNTSVEYLCINGEKLDISNEIATTGMISEPALEVPQSNAVSVVQSAAISLSAGSSSSTSSSGVSSVQSSPNVSIGGGIGSIVQQEELVAAAFVGKYGCPKSAIKCNTTKGYYSTAAACEAKRPTGNSAPCHVIKTYNGYGDAECWHYAHSCAEFSYGSYHTGNYKDLESVCGTNYPNTTRQYYCPKGTTTCDESHAVVLQDKKCGACECNTGFSRADDCNSLLYDIIVGYYDAANSCQAMGYNKTSGINNNCEACPYNARYWRCN